MLNFGLCALPGFDRLRVLGLLTPDFDSTMFTSGPDPWSDGGNK